VKVTWPPARETAEQPPHAGDVVFLLDESPHHSDDLANLHVLEAKLAAEALPVRLARGWNEPSRRGRRYERLLLVGRMPSECVVQLGDGRARRNRVATRAHARRREDATHQHLDVRVLTCEEVGRALHDADDGTPPAHPGRVRFRRSDLSTVLRRGRRQ